MNELQKTDWESQIALVKTMVAKDASDDEFELMLHMARKYNLDPLTKQIWLVKYRGQAANIFTGRDGFLDIAHRSGQFNGMDTKVDVVSQPIDKSYTFYNRKETRQEAGRFKREWQFKATCTVYRKDMEHPVTAEVFEEEYTTCQNLWKDKPRTMIGKVAESQALRKAFQISGLYSPDEMPEPQHEKELNPQKTPTQLAQEKFEAEKGIKPEPVEAEIVAPEKTPEQAAIEDQGRIKQARKAKLPKDIVEYFKAKKFTAAKAFEIMDANEDDPEKLRGYMKDHPIESATMPVQGEEGLP